MFPSDRHLHCGDQCEGFPASAILISHTSQQHSRLALYIFNACNVFTLWDTWYLLAHVSPPFQPASGTVSISITWSQMDNKARPGTAHRALQLLGEYTPAIIFKWTFCWLSPRFSVAHNRRWGAGVLRWDWGGLMRRRELPLSLGKQGCQQWGAEQTQELDHLEIQPSPRTPIASLLLLPPFSFYSLIETGWRKFWDRLTWTQTTSKAPKR